jgi:nucleotide-binding universal stress UspA family protein
VFLTISKSKKGVTMYNKIMVPLDGSELAECVMPHVESITTGCKITNVVFVRVVNPIQLPASVPARGRTPQANCRCVSEKDGGGHPP